MEGKMSFNDIKVGHFRQMITNNEQNWNESDEKCKKKQLLVELS